MSMLGANEGLNLELNEFSPHVLIIEENSTLRQLWSLIVLQANSKSQIDFVTNAEDAERLIQNELETEKRYNLVISNLFLKGEMTGLELWKLFSVPEISFPQFIIVSSIPIAEYERLLSDEMRKPLFVRKPLDPTFCGDLISKTFFEINQRTQMQKNLKGRNIK